MLINAVNEKKIKNELKRHLIIKWNAAFMGMDLIPIAKITNYRSPIEALWKSLQPNYLGSEPLPKAEVLHQNDFVFLDPWRDPQWWNREPFKDSLQLPEHPGLVFTWVYSFGSSLHPKRTSDARICTLNAVKHK